MYPINCQIAIIKPKKLYIDWINSLPEMEGNFDIGSLTKDCTAILLPDDLDSDEESLKYIKSILKNYLKLSLKAGISINILGQRIEVLHNLTNGSI